MDLLILFGQRKESYDGEFAPEPLECWSEFEVDGNPEGFEEACGKKRKENAKDFVAFKLFRVRVDQNAISDALTRMPFVQGVVSVEE